MQFYNKYLELCNSVGKSPSRVVLEIGLKKSAVTRWKAGGMPTDATLTKIADYFGCTVEELTAEPRGLHIKLPGNSLIDALQMFAANPEEAKKPAPEGELNKAALLAAVDTMTREELIQMLNAISKRLTEV